MVSRRQPERKVKPATTKQGREDQLVSLAHDLAEKQMRDGTAPSPVVTHFLKLGSSRESLEQQRLESENTLLKAKVEQMANADKQAEMYEAALAAMKKYSGNDDE